MVRIGDAVCYESIKDTKACGIVVENKHCKEDDIEVGGTKIGTHGYNHGVRAFAACVKKSTAEQVANVPYIARGGLVAKNSWTSFPSFALNSPRDYSEFLEQAGVPKQEAGLHVDFLKKSSLEVTKVHATSNGIFIDIKDAVTGQYYQGRVGLPKGLPKDFILWLYTEMAERKSVSKEMTDSVMREVARLSSVVLKEREENTGVSGFFKNLSGGDYAAIAVGVISAFPFGPVAWTVSAGACLGIKRLLSPSKTIY